MPLQATSGAASYDGFGGGVAAVPNYIEDVFSTYLYTGNGSTQTITNGIDLAGKGGLVWSKQRSTAANHALIDTARGRSSVLYSNLTDVAATSSAGSDISSFGTTGYSLGANNAAVINSSAETYASWTFRKQPKFFTCLTYSGNSTNRTITHDLGSVPGCILIKKINGAAAWQVYHRSLANTEYLVLNTTAAKATGATRWNSTTATSTTFSLGTDTTVNDVGDTYVAYLFAHDAGGFGLTGTDNVISCGSFTTDGSGNATVNLGYEPQYVMYKSASTAGGAWQIFDSMRGLTMGADNTLSANASTAEGTGTDWLTPSATGFSTVGASFYTSATYIYIAIRRGPMKVPTSGTSVFSPVAQTGNDTVRTVTHGFPVDMWIASDRNNSSNLVLYKQALFDRLQGNANGFITSKTDAWGGGWGDLYFNFANNVGVPLTGNFSFLNNLNTPYVYYGFRRAPSFFDEVCYTGTGVARTISHNLGVAPELMIVKDRKTAATAWLVYSAYVTNPAGNRLVLNDVFAANVNNSIFWNNTAPTSTVFSLGTYQDVNLNTDTYVAYLFATCAGVSKVGSYTGNGSSQTIDCGFTGGARFVLIKRTDSTGDWYVWDTARGIVAGNDPYVLLNSSAAEITNTDYIDTYSAGFEISSTAPAAINASGGTFIFLAIA